MSPHAAPPPSAAACAGAAPLNTTAAWFEEEVQPHATALRAYLRARFPSLADPDDVVQEAFVRIINARSNGTIRSVRALLFVTARNIALDVFRKERSNPVDGQINWEQVEVGEDTRPVTLELSSREQKLQLLEQAVQSLPQRCREIIMLKKLEGLSYEEIGQRLGISPHTVSAQLTIGMSKCREFFLAHGLLKGPRA